MKIQIKTGHLTESPYQHADNPSSNAEDPNSSPDEKSNGFIFDEDQLKLLSEELINSNPTSILISGFRGVGKTSYIEKLEECILTHEKGKGNIFVKLNFSKYEEYKFIIRKLIRNLYLALKKSDHWPDNEADKDKSQIQISDKLQKEIEALYQNTYLDVSEQLSIKKEESTETVKEVKMNFDLTSVLKVGEIILYGLGATALLGSFVDNVLKWLGGGALVGLAILKGFEFSRTFTNKKSESKSSSVDKSTIYDDEIADYLFSKVIEQLQTENVQLVFVLDELDKIQKEEDINKVINELKPFFLSGKCNYILVSGQDLYYQYFKSSTENDPVISSIFSRFFHVGLPNDLLGRLDNLLALDRGKTKGNSEDEALFYDLKQALIFDSNRLPRRLVSTVRKTMAPYEPIWEEGFALVEIDNSEKARFELKRRFEQSISNTIDALNTDPVIRENKPIRDLFINQFYVWANELMLLQENIDYKDSDLMRETAPWSDKLKRLKDKREMFLTTFLNDLSQAGILSYDSKEGVFSVSLSEPSERSKPAPKKRSTKSSSEKTPPVSKDAKAKNVKQKSIPTKEVVKTESTETPKSKQSPKTKKSEVTLSSEVIEFDEAFSSLVLLIEFIRDEMKAFQDKSNVFEPPPNFHNARDFLDEIQLHSSHFEMVNTNYKLNELWNTFTAIKEGLEEIKIPSDYQVRIFRSKKELLKALFMFNMYAPETAPYDISTDQIVISHATGGRFPNLDMFIQSERGNQAAIQFVPYSNNKEVGSNLIDKVLEFLLRAHKLSEELVYCLIVFWSDGKEKSEINLEKIRDYIQKKSPHDLQLISFAHLNDQNGQTPSEIYNQLKSIVYGKSLQFGHVTFPYEITNTNDKIQIDYDEFVGAFELISDSSEDQPYTIEVGDYFNFNSTDLGVPHLTILVNTENEFQIIIQIKHDADESLNDHAFFHINNSKNALKRPGLVYEPSLTKTTNGPWVEYNLNLFKEFQDSFWARNDLRFEGIERIEIIGNVKISSIRLRFDQDDRSFDEVNITDR